MSEEIYHDEETTGDLATDAREFMDSEVYDDDNANEDVQFGEGELVEELSAMGY